MVLGGLVVDYGRIGLPDACFLMFGSAAVFTVQLTYYVAGGFGGGSVFGGHAARARARRRARRRRSRAGRRRAGAGAHKGEVATTTSR